MKQPSPCNTSKSVLALMMALTFLLIPLSAQALTPVPKESGFSGFFRLGGGGMSFKSNMVSGSSFSDITDETISSVYSSPDSNSTGFPSITGELAYTFASTRTQLTLGSTLEDIARLENAQQFAVKQELGSFGLVSLGFLFSGMPAEVWKDPYVENQTRQDTDRKSTGLKFAYGDIFGSNFEFIYSYRQIEIDDEESGNWLNLSPSDKQLLNREGDSHKATLLYRFKAGDKHFIEPGITYFKNNRDGKAMENDGVEAQLTYLYMGDPISVVATGMVGKADFDQSNPIYGKTREDDLYLLGLQAYYKDPFGWKPFQSATISLYCGLSYYYEDSNIDFYETEVKVADIGLMIRF